jgi:hypothetical protein
MVIGDHSRCRLARFEVGVHFLQTRNESLNLLLLFCYVRFLFQYFPVLLARPCGAI